MSRVEVIGDCRLILGDCLEAFHLFGDADAIVTDPPYSSGGFNEAGKAGGSIGTTTHLRRIQGDTMSSGGYFNMMRRVLRGIDAKAAYVFTDWRMWPFTTEAVELSGYRLRGMLVWDKTAPAMGARWKTQHELICWGTKVVLEMGPGLGNVLSIPRSGNEHHPTEKPGALMVRLIGNIEGNAVADPFMGSGTTGVACASLGRPFIGCELDPHHFETACRRIEEAYRQPRLFAEPKPAPKQEALL